MPAMLLDAASIGLINQLVELALDVADVLKIGFCWCVHFSPY